MAINGSSVLGTVNAVDDTTRLSTFTPAGFPLAGGTTSKLGLPNFIQINSNALGGPSIDVAGVCVGDTTTISGTYRDLIDEFNWQVRKGGAVLTSSTQPSFKFLFPSAGVYTVSLRLHNRCAADTTLSQNVTIFDPPVAPVGAFPLCTGAVTLDANAPNAPDLTFFWPTTAETTKTIVVNQQNIYTVDIRNTKTGCVSTGNFTVVDNRPPLDLGADLTICQNNNTPALNAQNPGATYQWTINGVNTSVAQVQSVNTATSGVFTYGVHVTDPVTTCFTDDTKTYTINTSPSFTFNGSKPAASCGVANGTVSLQITATTPPTGPYSYFITGPAAYSQSGFDINTPTPVITYSGLAGGTYSVVVSDQVSGCTLSNSVGLNDASFTASANAATCDPSPTTVTVSGPAVAPLQYTFTNTATGQAVPPTATPNIANLPVGDYLIQVKDNNGCNFTFTHPVHPTLPIATINTNNLCTGSTLNATVNIGTPTGYLWTGPGITSGQGTSTIGVNASGTYTVAATVGGCGIKQTADIIYDKTAAANFTQSDACKNTVTLTATPTGTYTYRWYKGSVFQPTLLGRQIILGTTEDGAQYRVDILNSVNGCIYSSPTKAVQVTGPVTAAVTSTPPCEDGKPFTLTATTNVTGATYAWTFGGAPLTGTTASINDTKNGTYKVDVTKGSCKASAQIPILKSPIPEGLLPDRVVICNDPDNKDPDTNHYDLDPGNFSNYNWLKNQLNLSYTSRVYTATSEGQYEVELTNTFGCVANDKTDVRNECIPKIIAPNAFKPSSGITPNKEFFVLSFFITDDFEVFIYNRWGEMVYQSNDRHFKWNGGYNNNASQLLPGGTYAYVIRYVSAFRPDLGKQEQRGGVSLLR
jgi:gliding motility-associated-like protein